MSPADGAGASSCGGSESDLEIGHRVIDLVTPGYGDGDKLPSKTLGCVLPIECHVDGAGASAHGCSESDIEIMHQVIDLVPPGDGGELPSNTLGHALPMEWHADDVGGAGASADGGGSVPNIVARGETEEMVTPGDGEEETELIPKVRFLLHCVAGDKFTPLTMPIGPYHRGKGSYSPLMEEEKKNTVLKLGKLSVNVERLKGNLRILEPRVRRCYTRLHDDDIGPEDFTDMLLQDGCYLLCFFMDFKGPSGGTSSHNDNLGAQDNTVVRDILYLVENQVPLFVLEEMLRDITQETSASAQKRIAVCVEQVLQKQRYISKNNEMTTRPVTDLMHLVYSYFWPQPLPRRESQDSSGLLTGRWRRATDYSRYANLRFKRRRFKDTEKWTILNVELQGGTLHIPYLLLNSGTWTMLRNLMALEEQGQQEDRPVTAYCYFMSQLVCTAEDVDLLQRAKILEHFMGSSEHVAKAFADLCEGVAMDVDRPERNYLRWMWHKLEKRCSKRKNNFKGLFRQEYCSNTFRQMVFTAVLITSLCQVMQAIYAVVAYHKPPSPG